MPEAPDRRGTASAFRQRGASQMLEDVDWVSQNLGVKGLNATDAPSSRAWGLYLWATSGNETDFRKTYDVKLLPTRRQVERDQERKDSGEPILEVIERQLREFSQTAAHSESATA